MANSPTSDPPQSYLDIELFAGAGGLTLGLSAAGFPPHHVFEIDAQCCETLRHNSQTTQPRITAQIHQRDVANVDWSQFTRPVRLLAGGPPCQPFSNGGKHLADRDQRNQFPSTLHAVRELRPAVVLLENVPGLLRRSFKPYLDYLVRQLAYPSVEQRAHETWQEHDARLLYQRQRSVPDEPEYRVHQWTMKRSRLRNRASTTTCLYCRHPLGTPLGHQATTHQQSSRPSPLSTKRRLLATTCAPAAN